MSIAVTLSCCGCDATTTYELPPVEITPLILDMARVAFPKLRDHAPDGWVPYDPWTYITYCPTCMASIEAPAPARPIDGTEGERATEMRCRQCGGPPGSRVHGDGTDWNAELEGERHTFDPVPLRTCQHGVAGGFCCNECGGARVPTTIDPAPSSGTSVAPEGEGRCKCGDVDSGDWDGPHNHCAGSRGVPHADGRCCHCGCPTRPASLPPTPTPEEQR